MDRGHQEDLETLLDLLRATVELESQCDFAERPGGQRQNRRAFLAHFGELDPSLEAWDERVARVRAAPGGLWEWFARSAAERGIAEPPFAVGSLIDRLAVLTVERCRRGQLAAPHQLLLERFKDSVGGREFVSLYMEGQRVATLPGGPGEAADRLAAAERLIQCLFDDAQRCEQAREIDHARDSLLDLKQHLLDLLAEHAAVDPVQFAAGCPFCESQQGPGSGA